MYPRVNLFVVAFSVVAVLVGVAGVARADLILDLKASDYNPSTGVWTDSSGSGNSTSLYLGTNPTLVANETPNGSSAVYFSGSNALQLVNGISSSQPLSVFAYLMPTVHTGGWAADTVFAAKSAGPFDWRIWTGSTSGPAYQQVLSQQTASLGISGTALSTTAFSSINVQISSSTGTIRLNGANDGSLTGGYSSLSGNFMLIGGATHGGGGNGEFMEGYIAELRVYSDVTVNPATVEAQFTASYVTPAPTPEPSTLALLAAGLAGLLCYAWRKRR